MRIITIFLSLLVSASALAGHHEKPNSVGNIEAATKFMETVLTEPDVAQSLLHDDFDFEFMGVSQLAGVTYDKTTYFSEWLVTVAQEENALFCPLPVVVSRLRPMR